MKIEDMHWHLWEAIVIQARDMYSKGLVSKELDDEVTAITHATQTSGRFSDDLRSRACLVDEALKPNAEEWHRLLAIEYAEMP